MLETASAASEAPIEVTGSDALASMSSEQRSEWFKTGEMPAAPDPAPVVDEDAAEDAEEAAAITAPVAAKPVPTPEKPVSKRQQQINDLIRRAATAEQKLAALEQQGQRQPEAPAAKVEAQPTKPKPVQADFETYEDFLDARDEWRDEQKVAQAQQQRQTQSQQAYQREQQQRMGTWAERMQAFAETSPAFVEKAIPFLNGVRPGTPLGDTLMDSPVGPQLALHLVEHPEELTRIGALHPISAIRELGKIEKQIEIDAHTSASAGPVAKHVTTAPAPPVTLGSRPAEPADAIEAALGSQDFRAYAAAANRRELAKRK